METVFTPHYALIFFLISAIFIGGGYVWSIREQKQDIKDIKVQNQQIKDALHAIQVDSVRNEGVLANIQEQNRTINGHTGRELEDLKNRVSKLENEKGAK